MKSTLYNTVHGTQVQNFHPFLSTINHFQDIAHLRMPYKCHNFFIFLADRQKKSQPIFPHKQHTYNEVRLKSGENWERSRILKVIKLEILQSAPNDPKPTQGIGIKSTLHTWTVVPRVPNFRLFRSMISHFQHIAHFTICPLTPMLKFQSPTTFLIFGRLPNHL